MAYLENILTFVDGYWCMHWFLCDSGVCCFLLNILSPLLYKPLTVTLYSAVHPAENITQICGRPLNTLHMLLMTFIQIAHGSERIRSCSKLKCEWILHIVNALFQLGNVMWAFGGYLNSVMSWGMKGLYFSCWLFCLAQMQISIAKFRNYFSVGL